MASFATHALLGAGLRAASAKILGFTTDWEIGLAIAGFIEGAAPDAIDWVSAKLGFTRRWTLYTLFHTTWARWGMLFYGWGFHVAIDKIFHKRPGESWWPELGWLEVVLFCLGLGLVLWTFIS